MAMRRSLAWFLGAALALSALTLWVPQKTTTIVQAIDSRRPAPGAMPLAQNALAGSLATLPPKLEPLLIEPARRDPFADPAPPAPTPAAKSSPPPAPSSPAPAPPPPPMTWRLLGTMDSPTGERLVMLVQHNGQQSIIATPGLRLEGGYEVLAVQADAVRVVHPPTHAEVVIPIPPPPGAGR